MNTGRRGSFAARRSCTSGRHGRSCGVRSVEEEEVSARGAISGFFAAFPSEANRCRSSWTWLGFIARSAMRPGRCRSASRMNTAATRGPLRAAHAVELTGMATIQDVANHLCVGWDLIKELKKSDLARRYRKPKLRRLKHLAVDEICIGRGRRPNAGARSRHGRDRVCRAGNGGRCPETLLETAPGVAGEDPGRGGRLVSGIHQGGPENLPRAAAGLRPVSCREAVQ